MCQITEDANPVIDKDGNDAALCQFIAAERFFLIGTGVEAAAVYKYCNGTVLCVYRCEYIQIQTVFIIMKSQIFPELPVVKQPFGVIPTPSYVSIISA